MRRLQRCWPNRRCRRWTECSNYRDLSSRRREIGWAAGPGLVNARGSVAVQIHDAVFPPPGELGGAPQYSKNSLFHPPDEIVLAAPGARGGVTPPPPADLRQCRVV